MMLNLTMQYKTKRANKFIQLGFLPIMCQEHGNFEKGGCDLALIPMASPFLRVYSFWPERKSKCYSWQQAQYEQCSLVAKKKKKKKEN